MVFVLYKVPRGSTVRTPSRISYFLDTFDIIEFSDLFLLGLIIYFFDFNGTDSFLTITYSPFSSFAIVNIL